MPSLLTKQPKPLLTPITLRYPWMGCRYTSVCSAGSATGCRDTEGCRYVFTAGVRRWLRVASTLESRAHVTLTDPD